MLFKNIKEKARENENFRKVIFTGNYLQLVLMSIPPGGEIGGETHPHTDQILFLEEGKGQSVIEGQISDFKAGNAVFVPAGTLHNFINPGNKDLKVITIYSPPAHKDGTIHKHSLISRYSLKNKTKKDADKDEQDHEV